MSDTLEKLLLVACGSIITLLGTLATTIVNWKSDQRKRKDLHYDELRKSYSQLFAAVSVFVSYIRAIASNAQKVMQKMQINDLFIDDLKSIGNRIDPLMMHLNSIILLEEDEYRSASLVAYHELEVASQKVAGLLNECNQHISLISEQRQFVQNQIEFMKGSDHVELLQKLDKSIAGYSDRRVLKLISDIDDVKNSTEKISEALEGLKLKLAARFSNLRPYLKS